MQKKFWFPKSMPQRLVFFRNFRAKIGTYGSLLEFSAEEVEAMETLADEFIAAYSWVRSCETAMKAAFAWRDRIYGSPATSFGPPEPPAFPPPPGSIATQGLIEQMYKFRRQIVSSERYSAAIGADLGLIGSVETRPAAADLFPELRISVAEGNLVSIAGSMKKMAAMTVEYKPENGTWATAAFLTNLPMTINIPPETAGIAERGSIRAAFFNKNVRCGTYSVEYPVVLF